MSKRKTAQDFQFGSRIGEGSYSSVYKAADIGSKKIFAIKVLSKKHIVKEKKIKYVNIEKITLNRLGRHPGIVTLHYTFQDENSLYFVIDFAEQGELLTLIRKLGSLSESCSKYYMTQLIDAVDFMHKKGVIHRDLKPENILVNSERRIMITDFGAAKVLNLNEQGEIVEDEETEEAFNKGSFVGTAEYVSPELLQYNKCGFESDIWALGCILYQFIVGVPPFKGKTEYLTFEKIVNLKYQWPNFFIPELIKDIVHKTLKLEPKERLTISQLQKHQWFARLNWNDKSRIWAQGPPPLEPYRPVVEQQLQSNNNNFKKIIIQKKLPASTVKKNLMNSTIIQIRNTDTNGYLSKSVSSKPSPINEPIQAIQQQRLNPPQLKQPPSQVSPLLRTTASGNLQSPIQPQKIQLQQPPQAPELGLLPQSQQSASPFQPQKPGQPQRRFFAQSPQLNHGSKPFSPQYRVPQPSQQHTNIQLPKPASLPALQTEVSTAPKTPNSMKKESPVTAFPASELTKPAILSSDTLNSPKRSIHSNIPSPIGRNYPSQSSLVAGPEKKLEPAPAIVSKPTTKHVVSTSASNPRPHQQISSKPPSIKPPAFIKTSISSPTAPKPSKSAPKLPSKTSSPKNSPNTTKRSSIFDNVPVEVLTRLDDDEEIIKMDYINSSELNYSQIRTFDPNSAGNKLSPEVISLNDVLINEIITKNQILLENSVKRMMLIITDKGSLILFKNDEYIDEINFYLKVDLTDKSFAMYDYEFSEFSESGYLILELLKHEKLVFLSPLFKKTKAKILQHSKLLIEPNLGWIDSLLKTKEILKNKSSLSLAEQKKPLQAARNGPQSLTSNTPTSVTSRSPTATSAVSSVATETSKTKEKKPQHPTSTTSTTSSSMVGPKNRRISNPSANGIVSNLKTVHEIKQQNKKFAGGAAAAAFKASR